MMAPFQPLKLSIEQRDTTKLNGRCSRKMVKEREPFEGNKQEIQFGFKKIKKSIVGLVIQERKKKLDGTVTIGEKFDVKN